MATAGQMKITVHIDIEVLEARMEALEYSNRIDETNLKYYAETARQPVNEFGSLIKEANDRISKNSDLIRAYEVVIVDINETLHKPNGEVEKMQSRLAEVKV